MTKSINAGYSLAVRNIKREINEHMLGYSWNIITPVVYAFFFVVIKRGVLQGDFDWRGDQALVVLNTFMGVALFQLWFQSLNEGSTVITKNKGLLRGLSLDIKTFILALIFENGIGYAIRLVIIAIAFALLNIQLSLQVTEVFIIVVALLSMMTTSVFAGLLLAPWATLYPDVRKGLSTLNLPLILLSPIFYEAAQDTSSIMFYVNCINPYAASLATISGVLNGTSGIYVLPMLCWLAVSLFGSIILSALLTKQTPVLLERVG